MDLMFSSMLQTAPEDVFEMVRMFPPFCRVLAVRHLIVPAPGRVGRVVGYRKAERTGNVYLMVQDELAFLGGEEVAEDETVKGCAPEWLVVVQYDGNKTPAWVAQVRAGEAPPTTSPHAQGEISGVLADPEPLLWFVRMDTGLPVELHPNSVYLEEEGGLFIEEDDRRVPVCYAEDALVLRA